MNTLCLSGDPCLRDGDAGKDECLPPRVLRLPAVLLQVAKEKDAFRCGRVSITTLFSSLSLVSLTIKQEIENFETPFTLSS